MDLDTYRMIYRIAELETENRMLKEKVNQADNANLYLLSQRSSSQLAYQTPRILPTSPFPHGLTSTRSTELDLLSFDENNDSGYDTRQATTANTSFASSTSAVGGKHANNQKRDEDVFESTEPRKLADDNRPASLIDHGDSCESPPENGPQKIDLRTLRKKPSKSSFGIGILNAHRSRSRAKGAAETGQGNEDGFTIKQHNGTVIFVPYGDDPPVKIPKKESKFVETPPNEPDDHLEPMPSPPPIAPPTPAFSYPFPPHRPNPNRPPLRNGNGIDTSRWAPYPPNNPRNNESKININTNSSLNYNPGPREVKALFTSPATPSSHSLYRTVLITNIPTTTEIANILKHAPSSAIINMINTVGMKTDPPMETKAMMLTLKDSVTATKFVDFCNKTAPFDFEAKVDLMRTGTCGQFGKGKKTWENRVPPWVERQNEERLDEAIELPERTASVKPESATVPVENSITPGKVSSTTGSRDEIDFGEQSGDEREADVMM